MADGDVEGGVHVDAVHELAVRPLQPPHLWQKAMRDSVSLATTDLQVHADVHCLCSSRFGEVWPERARVQRAY